ncbi:rRNA maturation RNase YbeY [Pararhodobacter marinus]|uniref:Endoribonuclease YbeY n=1 Tax=Pararhodobacter marinus TaxID=2184063 RepID=A0A2U2CB39_9RHOB|nr:rRNA maturation RNase YbeY [Pararhodobacter marinus]PWE29079.1 rRNA maturation RNase YbeY [Pararhodobacter marinus]
MPVELVTEDERWGPLDLAALAPRVCAETLAHLGHDPALVEISLLACDDARIRTLNAQFRAKDKPTNVLSWPTWDLSPDTPGGAPEAPETGTPDDPEMLGDIALAFETCTREAREQGKSAADHATHLIVHSTLHLLGYDHETEEDAALMEKTEVEILAKLGIRDPYATDDSGLPQGVAGVD